VTTRHFLASLQRAQENGIVIVAITQCHEGGVELDVYEAGSRLRGAGVLSGGGMTREALFGKLQALLGSDLSLTDVRRLIELDLCGELAVTPIITAHSAQLAPFQCLPAGSEHAALTSHHPKCGFAGAQHLRGRRLVERGACWPVAAYGPRI
jgi:hypothetical protein